MHRLIPIAVLLTLFCACAAEREVPHLPDDQRLPASPPYTHLVFRAYVGEIAVLVDGQRIYAFRDPQSAGRLTLHVAELPANSAGKQIEFKAPDPPQDVIVGASYLATDATLPFAIRAATAEPLRLQAGDILLGMTMFVIGLIAIAASLIRRRGDIATMRTFGVFTLLYGVRAVMDTSWALAFGFTWQSLVYTQAFITYVIPIFGWMLAQRLIGERRRSLQLQVIAFAIFAPIGIASDLITHTPRSLDPVNNVLVIVGSINLVVNLLRAKFRSFELRVVTAGSIVFMLFALANNLSNLGIVPWDYDGEALGFTLFVATLGFAATRAFVRGERESIALDNELRTAREIQQSILPRAMPNVNGLRFDARYIPATSVGGDLYHFLGDDDSGAGVLVADVAGHGVPAALIASMLKIAVSSQARLANDPAALLDELNGILRRDVRRAFVTATYLWFDTTQRHVAVCNGGHPAPLLLRDGAFIELGEAGVLLGRFADARYAATVTELQDGDRIVAYTDGIIEARNSRGELFGEARFQELLRSGSSAEEVLTAVQRWRGNADDADDLTIVAIEVERRRPAG